MNPKLLEILVCPVTKGPLVHRMRSKDGSYRWFETTYCLVRSGDTDAPHIHLTSRDITARKAAEDALRRQTARLHSILASIGDGVVVLDPDVKNLSGTPLRPGMKVTLLGLVRAAPPEETAMRQWSVDASTAKSPR